MTDLPAHVRYVEAPNDYHPAPGDPPAVFLAGGITACPDWQAVALARLAAMDTPMVVLNPRRVDFPMGNLHAGIAQIEWEYHHLHLPGVITLVWFPECVASETVQPIAFGEMMQALGEGRPLVVGADPNYPRLLDVQVQCRLARPELQVRDRLSDVVFDTWRAVQAASRSGGETRL